MAVQGPISNSYRLFNKYINLAIYPNGSATPVIKIMTPNINLTYLKGPPTMNRKPEIQITGTFVSDVSVPCLQVRVTNLYTPFPIWTYANHKMTIEVGYVSEPRLTCSFSGKIMSAGEEKPGPDSITTFQLYLGDYDFFNTAFVGTDNSSSVSFSPGSTVGAVVQYLLNRLNQLSTSFKYAPVYNPNNSAGDISLLTKGSTSKGVDFSGTISSAFQELKLNYNLDVFMDGPNVRILKHGDYFGGTKFEIMYVTSISRNAASYVIKAPWIPTLRPFDVVYADPRIFKQSLGGQVSPPTLNQKIMTVDYDFSSVGKTNTMTLFTVNPGDQ